MLTSETLHTNHHFASDKYSQTRKIMTTIAHDAIGEVANISHPFKRIIIYKEKAWYGNKFPKRLIKFFSI